jgi:hypothetical protein
MGAVESEQMGETFRCPGCGITVSFSYDRPTIVVDVWKPIAPLEAIT